MKAYFNISEPHKVIDAIDVIYYSPVIHPTRIAPRFHDFVYIMDGSFDFCTQGVLSEVFPGDVFILPANSEYSGNSYCPKLTRTIYIHAETCAGEILQKGMQPYPEKDFLPLPRVMHCQGDELIKSLFLEMADIYRSDFPQKDKILSDLFSSLICILYNFENKKSIGNRDIVSECTEIMRNEQEVFFKEGEMAERLFVSPKTLRAAFMKRYNKTFYKFQLDNKLDISLSIIIHDSNIKLYEIAERLGFSDAFHLSKLFKKRYGFSPSEYRKRLKK
jgi:AraC-like DNA-binding protein